MDSLIKFRVATDDRARLETAASDAGKSLSEWARDTLLAVCNGEMAVQASDCRVIDVTPSSVGTARPTKDRLVSSGRPDPEKIAAFQRKTGMTVFDKRRNRG